MTAQQLSTSERAVLGTLLELNGEPLPASVARLLEYAPESFSDRRLGAIAVAVRDLRAEGRPHRPVDVLPALRKAPEGTALLLGTLPDEALPAGLAEVEAKDVLKAYKQRQITATLDDGLAIITADPTKAPVVAEHVVAVLDGLKSERSGGQWHELVEDGADIVVEELPPITEIVEGIVSDQAKLVIGAGSKSFKTWLTIHMALCIAHGRPWLERRTVRQRVLYVNLELKAATFKRRVQAIARALGIEIDREWFKHLPLRGRLAGLTVYEAVTRIIDLAKRFGAGVAVLDPVYKLNVEGEENNSRDQTLFFNQLDRITTEAGCTVILNDHFSKGNKSETDPLDAIRGSSAEA